MTAASCGGVRGRVVLSCRDRRKGGREGGKGERESCEGEGWVVPFL
jgi:hypothetical protein